MLDSSFFSKIGKKGCKLRWQRAHAKVRINNKMSKEKVAINAYLCGDGDISKRIDKNGAWHYEIRFFLDHKYLADRIVRLLKKEFNIVPAVRKKQGYFKIEIKNKPACLHLLTMGKYGSLDWEMPENLEEDNLKEWLRCFFDCEAYVNHHNRQIQVKSVNQQGLLKIQEGLSLLGIDSKVYGPYKQKGINHNDYCMLTILTGDLRNYQKLINFYHPDKKIKLPKIF